MDRAELFDQVRQDRVSAFIVSDIQTRILNRPSD